ncbi:MAG: YhcH/YjgK/YiaL family protein [Bacteroidales bacterium]
MILDVIENSALIEKLNPRFKKAFDFIKSFDFRSSQPGRIDIDGNDIYASISEFGGKLAGEAKLETHTRYIDIQIPINVIETIGWKSASNLSLPAGDYDIENDIRFYEDEPTTYINITHGEYILFFPEDAHAPGISRTMIKKAVVKVKI